jgi:hypothetical protein
MITALFCVFCYSPTIVAQSASALLPEESGERIALISDRNMYAVSEYIYFDAWYFKTWYIKETTWSSVLYIELISWDGVSLAQKKVPLSDGMASGALKIPSGLLSGTYYLRAYTAWMRNYSPYSYTYLPVKIINPLTEEVYPGPGEVQRQLSCEKQAQEVVELPVIYRQLKAGYSTRQKVSLDLKVDQQAFTGEYSVSIVPAGAPVTNGCPFAIDDSISQAPNDFMYYPEKEGITLSAKAIDRQTGSVVKNKKVQLSSFTRPFYFGTSRTDEQGMAYFILPEIQGTYEFYMVAESNDTLVTDLLINSEYCRQPVRLPFVPLELNEDESVLAELLVRNSQIMERFAVRESISEKGQADQSFYGHPVFVVYKDEFIELEDLKEFFFELVPKVFVRSPGKDPHLVVLSETSLQNREPLILIDNIPVENNETVLNLSCKMIDRVEVINKGYVAGPYKFSGLVSIFSRDKDVAGYALPENSHFFNFSLIAKDSYESTFDALEEQAPYIPDLRSTLYQGSGLHLSSEQFTSLTFYTSDVKGIYKVIVRGAGKEGTILQSVTEFEVQ